MKSVLLIIAVLAAIPVLHAQRVDRIPPDCRVILEDSSAAWKPTSVEFQSALDVVQKFLEAPIGQSESSVNTIRKILKNVKQHRVQAWGVIKEGEKIIFLNFFPAPPGSGKDSHSNWTTGKVMVDEGGFYYWQVEVDLNLRKVLSFSSNGRG